MVTVAGTMLYEVQNSNHVETFNRSFPQLELIEPQAQRAFELLVDFVENRAPLPPDQCIPRGGALQNVPTSPVIARRCWRRERHFGLVK